MEKITSINNQEIKNVVKLRKARERKNKNVFVVEGRHEISLAIESGVVVQSLFFCSDFSSDENFFLDTKDAVHVSEEVFRKMSIRETPDGCLIVAGARKKKLKDIKLRSEALILVLESLEKPGNIGAILRTADAVDVDVVIICNSKTDIYNQNVIRASLGTVFTNTIVECSNTEAFEWLETKNIKTFATTPKGKILYSEVDYSGSSAVFIGAEHAGLSEELFRKVDTKIKIPMLGKIDSLNASVSTAIVLYEAKKQRNFQS